MTIPLHFPVGTSVPVYCIEWIAPDVLVYSGGGGKSKTGVGNWLRALHIPADARTSADVSILAEVKLSSDEDAPMCMAIDSQKTKTIVLGINEVAPDGAAAAQNRHLRFFSYDIIRPDEPLDKPSVSLASQTSAPSLHLKDATDSYLRLLSFSPTSSHIIVASTEGTYALHDWPSLQKSFSPTDDFQGEEIMDADFSQGGGQLVVCSGKRLKIFGTFPAPLNDTANPSSDLEVSETEATLASNASLDLGPTSSPAHVDGSKAAQDAARALGSPPTWHTIQNPALGGEGNCEFRAVRFGRKDVDKRSKDDQSEESTTLLTVVNAKASSSGGKGKKSKRKSFVTSWSLPDLSITQTRQLSEKPVTTFNISPSGRLLAYGSSDLSIGVVDSDTLRVKMRVLESHAFPATGICWSLPSEPANGPKQESQDQGDNKDSAASVKGTSLRQSCWLASCSADGSLRLIRIPAETNNDTAIASLMTGVNKSNLLMVLFLTILILLLSMYVQRKLL